MTTKTDDLTDEITLLIRKVLYPSPLMRYIETLTTAETAGRIKRSKYSVLRYGIRQFVISQINTGTEVYTTHKVQVVPMDDEVIVSLKKDGGEINVITTYPDWLLDFLDDDKNFALMLPDCEERTGEVAQRIYEWCLSHQPYDLLVASS